MKYVKPERVPLKSHPELNERWVQERIADDPAILGLGELVLKDKERIHAGAGRLDLLCQDQDAARRFEIEIQLGRTDESHIIRTLEYWDLERKRYPQYEHVAVIVAEEITGRFLNVIGLFNGTIPLVAIQMQAFRIDNSISLVFTTVLSEVQRGLVEEDEVEAAADRNYWEGRVGKAGLELADEVLAVLHEVESSLTLRYNKHYVGTGKDGQPMNFVILKPKKEWIRVEVKLERSDDIQARLEQAGIDLLEYSRYGRYQFRLRKGDAQKQRSLLMEVFRLSYDEFGR